MTARDTLGVGLVLALLLVFVAVGIIAGIGALGALTCLWGHNPHIGRNH